MVRPLLLIWGLSLGCALAQTDVIYPWLTHQDLFRGTLIVSNLGNEDARISLTATRPEGEAPATQTVNLNLIPLQQLVVPVDQLFPDLGPGKGFMVRLTSEANHIHGALVNRGLSSASGSSPAQANVLAANEASSILIFNYLFNGNGFSAPVIINLADEPATLTIEAWQNGQRAADPIERTIAANHPFTNTSANLFPNLQGEMYLLVYGQGARLLGTTFVFNELLEPAMANAVPLLRLPGSGAGDPVDFESQIMPVINTNCRGFGCHAPGDAAGLYLQQGQAYDNIVGVASSQNPALSLIEPGQPMASYLYLKLLAPSDDVSYLGGRMPRNLPDLNQQTLQLFSDWITQGAPRSTGGL